MPMEVKIVDFLQANELELVHCDISITLSGINYEKDIVNSDDNITIWLD